MTIPAEPQVLHAVPGRVRVHVPALAEHGARSVEAQVRRAPGVRDVAANPLTGNVLVRFDPRVTTIRAILDALRTPRPDLVGSEPGRQRVEDARAVREEAQTSPTAYTRAPRVLSSGRGRMKRARIAMRGMDRDPDLARRVVERLERQPSVRARANPLTGRVLVEFDAHRTDIEDLLAAIAAVELPALPGEDTPSHPLDPAPLIQSAARTVGAILGLGLVSVRRVAGVPVVTLGAATAAGILNSVQGFPLTRNGLRTLLGRDRADLLLSGASIVTLALSNSPLGLLTTGAEALRLLTEVVARRAAWRRYEEHLDAAAEAVPGAVIRLKAGQRAPLAATVVEGTGTAIDRDGTLIPVEPGSTISAGARLQGGPFVVELHGAGAFEPGPRPAPPAPALPDRYQRVLGPLALAYAAGTALITRSPARALEALLLVNPRTALIGVEAASTGAAARALRAGVTVVGTRPIRRPDALLLDGARVLTDGAELTGVVPLDDTRDVTEVQAVAAAVAAAAGSPWGGAFGAAGEASGADGAFDGTTATATIGGTRYTLDPPREGEHIAAAERLRGSGAILLVLRSEREACPLALVALRPRLAAGVADLVAACQHHGVEIGLLSRADPAGVPSATARAVARRVGVPLLEGRDMVAVVRARQAEGALVAVLSDSVQTAEAFAACDLAIGITSGRSGRFPARADLLAPDVQAVVAIVEAGARREATARDSVALSVAANVAGIVWGYRGRPGVERASRAVYVTALAALADGWARLRGGEWPPTAVAWLADPRPER